MKGTSSLFRLYSLFFDSLDVLKKYFFFIYFIYQPLYFKFQQITINYG